MALLSIDTSSIQNQLQAIISKRSEAIMDASTELYKKSIHDSALAWKREIRILLSSPHIPGVPNNSLFPKLRTGKLMRSLVVRSGSKRVAKTKTMLTITPLWRPVLNERGQDYGDILDRDWEHKNFHNWKGRTRDILEQRVRRKLQ